MADAAAQERQAAYDAWHAERDPAGAFAVCVARNLGKMEPEMGVGQNLTTRGLQVLVFVCICQCSILGTYF